MHTLAGGTLPPFRSLVIIEEGPGAPYHLLYCEEEWQPLMDTWHQTLEEAKAQAEFEYGGIGRVWKARLKRA